MFYLKSIWHIFLCMGIILTMVQSVAAEEVPPAFDRQWATRAPWGAAQDASGNIYVVDPVDMQIKKFDSDGLLLHKWASCGTNTCSSNAWDIATDSSGNVYVSNGNVITVFDQNGNYLLHFGNSSSPYIPNGIATHSAVDFDGNEITYVYVTNSLYHKVQKFTSEGDLVTEWGGPGNELEKFRSPYDVAVDSEGYVYVADTLNSRIQKFDSDGVFIDAWSTDTVQSLATDASDNVYAVFSTLSTIMKFNPEGVLLTQWGEVGTGVGQFQYPFRINIGPYGEILVSDTGNNRIQIFKSTILDTDGDGIDDVEDNCVDDVNPSQADADDDGPGDACDTCPLDPLNDLDDDGICGDADNCPEYPNANQADQDDDGVGDVCDPCDDRGISGSISPSKEMLWPPNHSMIPVVIDTTNLILLNQATQIWIESVDVIETTKKGKSIYKENNLEPDYVITDALNVNLRSERAGTSTGRTYRINVIAEDCSAQKSFNTEVFVPHDKGK